MRSLLVVSFLFFAATSGAQDQPVSNETSGKNVIKINIASLFVKNVSLQYERAVAKKMSFAVGVRFQPYGSLPFQSKVKEWVDEPDVQVGAIKTGNFAITPEWRFYMGKEALRGFYIAPYARYANYKMEAPVNYNSLLTTKTAFFNGNISSFSGGILLGSQFRLTKSLTLDWWIIGAHFGASDGNLDFTANLTPSEQADLRSTLDDIDIPFFNIEHDINANGGTITSKGAWAGFRGFAINLGYRF